jgi:hypothetical protein
MAARRAEGPGQRGGPGRGAGRRAGSCPRSEETERAVLGAILMESRIRDEIARTLRPEDFYETPHRVLYEVFQDLASQGTGIDLRTVQATLEQRGQLERVGGIAYLTALELDLPDIGRINTYAEIVKDRSIRRRLIQTAEEVIRDSQDGGRTDGGRTAREVLETFQRRLGVLAQATEYGPARSRDVPDIITLGELSRKIIPDREDVLAGVLKVGDASCISGQPGRGKSLVAVAAAIAIASGRSFAGLAVPRARPVLYVDGELLEIEVKDRALKLAAGLGLRPADFDRLPLRWVIETAQPEEPPKLGTPAGRARLDVVLDLHPEIEVLVLDSLRILFGLGDENKSESWAPVNDFLLAMKRRGLTVLCIHHNSRADNFNGHLSGATAFSQIVNLTERTEGEDAVEVTAMDWGYFKARSLTGAEKIPFGLRLEGEPDGRLYFARCEVSSKKKGGRPPHSRKAESMELLAQGVSTRKRVKLLGVTKSVIQAWDKEAKAAGGGCTVYRVSKDTTGTGTPPAPVPDSVTGTVSGTQVHRGNQAKK